MQSRVKKQNVGAALFLAFTALSLGAATFGNGPYLKAPADGTILVVTSSVASTPIGTNGPAGIVAVDPSNGQQTFLSQGGTILFSDGYSAGRRRHAVRYRCGIRGVWAGPCHGESHRVQRLVDRYSHQPGLEARITLELTSRRTRFLHFRRPSSSSIRTPAWWAPPPRANAPGWTCPNMGDP